MEDPENGLQVSKSGQFGGGGNDGRVAVTGSRGALRAALVAALEDDGVAVSSAGAGAVREQVARGRTDVGVFITDAATTAYDDAPRRGSGNVVRGPR